MRQHFDLRGGHQFLVFPTPPPLFLSFLSLVSSISPIVLTSHKSERQKAPQDSRHRVSSFLQSLTRDLDRRMQDGVAVKVAIGKGKVAATTVRPAERLDRTIPGGG